MKTAKFLILPCLLLAQEACTSHPLAKVANAVGVSFEADETIDGKTLKYKMDVPQEQGKQLSGILARVTDNEAYQPRHVFINHSSSYVFTMPDGKKETYDTNLFTPKYGFAEAGYDVGNGIYLFQTEEDKRDFKTITDGLLRQLPPKSQWKVQE